MREMQARVSEEAEAFQKLAPSVLGRETMRQKALKPPPRFHPRVGAAAFKAPPQWREREIVSEYGFAPYGHAPGEASLAALHELRQVISVDGRQVADDQKARDNLAKMIAAPDDARKMEALEQFEKYGLPGAVTDFGELILLFTRRDMGRYEFTAKGMAKPDDGEMVFEYKQREGPEALTVIDAKRKDRLWHMRLEGEIRVRAGDYVPVRITMAANEDQPGGNLREEASVDYEMSRFGALLPVSVQHRELRAGKVIMENRFSYSDFRKFGASSDIKFEPADKRP